MVPFAPLAELSAHEEELLAGQRPHVREEQPEVGRHFPFVVPRHLRDQRLLQVHDLVVGQRQHEVLGVRVHPAEGQLAVVPLAEDRIDLHVVEGVVHPAHVPLHREAEAPDVDGTGDHRPGGRLLGDRDGVREAPADLLVELTQEDDRVDVFAPAVRVGDPLAGLARKVEVDHRRHGIDPQSVGVKPVEPVESRGQEKAAHLVAAVVEDAAAPVGLIALAPVGVLVEVRAVEIDEAVLVGGKVRGHPVEDDADPGLVERVDEGHEVLRRAEPGGRREEPGALIAPGPRERVLHDRKQLHVREAHGLRIGRQVRRDLAVGQRPLAFVGDPPPGAEMHLVDGHRPTW